MAHKEYMREWRKKRIETPTQTEARKKWQRKATLLYWERHPWARTLNRIQGRCGHAYKKYGTKCLITKDELQQLWFRDKAYLMKHPSIDRIDTFKDYTFDNCRYIEKSINTGRQFKKGGRAWGMWKGKPRK